MIPESGEYSQNLLDRIKRIKGKLRHVQLTWWWKAILRRKIQFGVGGHHYMIRWRLTERAITAFETEHQISLPIEYRAFLTKIGNGGAGPYFGIYPLSVSDKIIAQQSPIVEPPTQGFLASPCPIPAGFSPVDRHDWENEVPPAEWGPYQGTVTIGHQGCAYETILIVTGAMRGRVCNIGDDMPIFAPHSDFLAWYEEWLDMTLAGEEIRWFGLNG